MSDDTTSPRSAPQVGTWAPILHCPDPAAWIERLDRHWTIDPETGCHLWVGVRDNRSGPSTGRRGYGKFKVRIDGRARTTGAHRAMWLAKVGDIPEGMQVDHLCHRPPCVNVDHLELVTPRENTVRAVRAGLGVGRRVGSGPGCSRHGLSDGYERADKRGYVRWICRICTSEYNAKWRAIYRERKQAA